MNFTKKLSAIVLAVAVAATSLTAVANAAPGSATGKSIKDAKVAVASATYTGKAQAPKVTVQLDGKTLVEGTDFTVVAKDVTNAGEAKITIVGTGNYAGEVAATYIIKKATAKVTVKANKKTVKVRKKAQTVKITVKAKAGSKKTFKVTKTPKKASKYIKVSKSGKVTLKKGAKKGTYKVKVTVTNKNYKTVKKTITVKVK